MLCSAAPSDDRLSMDERTGIIVSPRAQHVFEHGRHARGRLGHADMQIESCSFPNRCSIALARSIFFPRFPAENSCRRLQAADEWYRTYYEKRLPGLHRLTTRSDGKNATRGSDGSDVRASSPAPAVSSLSVTAAEHISATDQREAMAQS